MMATSPFFIVGCGRSGTTLLRTMLNQHSALAIPLESLFIADYLRASAYTPPETYRKLIVTEYELREWGMSFSIADFDGCVTARDFIDRAHMLYMSQHNKTVWGQKTPRFVRYGNLLRQHYPTAKFIIIIRDPRAVVSSLMRSNVHYSNALYGARRWLRDGSSGVALEKQFPGDVLSVRYEDLVTSPAPVLHHMCDFLQVDFENALLNYHQTGTMEYGTYYAQIHQQLNRAPDQSRINAWREHLSTRQINVIESVCGTLMPQFGYMLSNPDPVIPRWYRAGLKAERAAGLARQIIHNAITRRGYLTSFVRRKLALSLLRNTVKHVNY